ncbi:MAG TPA: Ig-like domain-containing protein, partial [Verrucomicrobiae bacterium]|nr:Ig-like domain-containing protein [Verrucomicrobiae bacterium]
TMKLQSCNVFVTFLVVFFTAAPIGGANLPPTVVLNPPTGGMAVPAGTPLALSATASDPDGAVTKVDFYVGDTLLGTANPIVLPPGFPPAPFFYLWQPTEEGVYLISARATDDQGAVAVSLVQSVVIGPGTPNMPPTVSLRRPANGAQFSKVSQIVLEAEATDDGQVMSVEFFDFGVSVGTVATAPYVLTLPTLEAGDHILSAVATDDNGNTTTSDPVIIKILPPSPNLPPTIQLLGVQSLDQLAEPVNLRLTATAQDTDGSIASVEYFDGEKPLGKSAAAPFPITISNLAFGIHTLTARATDNEGSVGASAPATIRVSSPPSGVPSRRLSALLDDTKTKINLTATADAGFYYALEASPDLISWYPLEEFLMTSSVHTFQRAPRRSAEFFRLQPVAAADLPNPLRVFTDVIGKTSVQGEATAEPFTLTLTNALGTIFTLHIPTNALFSPTRIQMTEVRDASSFPFSARAAQAVEFSPKGLLLLDAAFVTVKLPAVAGPGKLTAFAYRSDGSDFHLVAAETEANTITMGLFSLAGCGVSVITTAELQAQELRRPGALSSAREQTDAVLELKRSSPGLLSMQEVECASSARSFRREYYTEIEERLFANLGDTDCDNLVRDWFEFTVFRNRMAFSPCAQSLAVEINAMNLLLDQYSYRLAFANRVKFCLEKLCNDPFPPENIAKMLRLHAFAQRTFPATFVAGELMPILKKCLSFDLEMDSNNTVTGPTLDAGARINTPAGRLHLRLVSLGGSPILSGQSELQYKSVKWNKLPDNCRREDETLVSGSALATLDFHLNFQDSAIAAADAMELELYIKERPEELSKVICQAQGDVSTTSNDPLYWYGSFVESHEQDRLSGSSAGGFVFGLWNLPLGSPWATWSGPREKRQGLVLHKDQTTFKLYHTPGI